MMRGGPKNYLSSHLVVRREERADETSASHLRKLDRFVDARVRHDGIHGSERFDVVRLERIEGGVAIQERRGEERSFILVARGYLEIVGITEHQLRPALELLEPISNFRHLRPSD